MPCMAPGGEWGSGGGNKGKFQSQEAPGVQVREGGSHCGDAAVEIGRKGWAWCRSEIQTQWDFRVGRGS